MAKKFVCLGTYYEHKYGAEEKDDSWTYFIRYRKTCTRCGHIEQRDVNR